MPSYTHFQRILFLCHTCTKCSRNFVFFRRKVEGIWPTQPPSCASPEYRPENVGKGPISYKLDHTINCEASCPCRPVDTGGQCPPIICQTCFWRCYKCSLIWQQFWQQFILAIHAPPHSSSAVYGPVPLVMTFHTFKFLYVQQESLEM